MSAMQVGRISKVVLQEDICCWSVKSWPTLAQDPLCTWWLILLSRERSVIMSFQLSVAVLGCSVSAWSCPKLWNVRDLVAFNGLLKASLCTLSCCRLSPFNSCWKWIGMAGQGCCLISLAPFQAPSWSDTTLDLPWLTHLFCWVVCSD